MSENIRSLENPSVTNNVRFPKNFITFFDTESIKSIFHVSTQTPLQIAKSVHPVVLGPLKLEIPPAFKTEMPQITAICVCIEALYSLNKLLPIFSVYHFPAHYLSQPPGCHPSSLSSGLSTSPSLSLQPFKSAFILPPHHPYFS